MKLPSNRPYIFVCHSNRPSSEEGKIESVEMLYVQDTKNKNLFDQATVVIDLLNLSCLKNRFIDHEETSVIDHYLSKYKDKIKTACKTYAITVQNQNTLEALKRLERKFNDLNFDGHR